MPAILISISILFGSVFRQWMVRDVSKHNYDAKKLQDVLIKCAVFTPQSRILDLGWTGKSLFSQCGIILPHLIFIGDDIREVRACEETGLTARHLASPIEIDIEQRFDMAFYHPEGHATKGQVFHWIDAVFEKLKVGGHFFFSGQKDRGVLSYVKYIESVFTHVERVGRSGRMQYFEAIKKSKTSGVTPQINHQMFEVSDLPGGNFQFITQDGVFSRDGIDPGSRLLLEHVSIAPEAQVFDVGCGYGLLGVVCARLAQRGQVWLSDVSMRAVTCATENVVRNQITNAQVAVGDLYENVGETQLDLIVSNPPFHEGNKTAWPLIDGAIERLNANGALMLVVMRAGPYIKRMDAVFGQVEICAEEGGYTVLKGQKKN